MSELDHEVLAELVRMLEELQGDWEYEGEIHAHTRFVADLGLESLEIVVLSTLIQQRYGKLPFPAFFEEIGRRAEDERDVSVAELVAFVTRHRQPSRQKA